MDSNSMANAWQTDNPGPGPGPGPEVGYEILEVEVTYPARQDRP